MKARLRQARVPHRGAPGRRAGSLALALVMSALAASAGAALDPDTLGAARQATDRRDFTAALPLYGRLVAADPQDADLLIEAARVHGFADRNAEAARLYRQALAAAPGRRADILPSLAWQTLWADAAGEALPLFEVVAAEAAAEPVRADALDGQAQARVALGDNAGAIAAWRAALALRPGDEALRRQLAAALGWAGRHDEAIAMLQDLAARAPGDRDRAWALAAARNQAALHGAALVGFARLGPPLNAGERLDLAQAWRWAGFDDRAAPLLEGLDLPDAQALRQRVARETSSHAFASVEAAEDRDDLRTRVTTLGVGWRPAPGALAEVRVRSLSLDYPAGSPSSAQLQGLLRWRLGEPTAPRGTLWPTLALRIMRFGDWQAVTGSARATWVPRDRWRLDADAGRELVETPLAIANRVHVDTWSLGVDHRPRPGLAWAASAAALRFDDGNLRRRMTARVEHRLRPAPRWTVGAEGQHFESSDPAVVGGVGYRGYWNPRRYEEWRLFAAFAAERGAWDLYGRIGLGGARETNGDGVTTQGTPHLWELRVGHDLSPTVRLGVAAGGSGSGLGLAGGGSGYWRRYLNLSVSGWF